MNVKVTTKRTEPKKLKGKKKKREWKPKKGVIKKACGDVFEALFFLSCVGSLVYLILFL